MSLTVIGKSVKRLDGLEKVTGQATFTYDMVLPGMLHGKVLRSPYAHALIKRIDVSEAIKIKGVKAVVTSADLQGGLFGTGLRDEPVLAKGKVRFQGEPVAAVAATTAEIAEKALAHIDVVYEELPAVFDPEEAGRENSPVVVHPGLFAYQATIDRKSLFLDEKRPNVYRHFKLITGNVADGFAKADVIHEGKYCTAMIQHCPLEPHVAIGKVDLNGDVTVWTSAQSIYVIKNMLCEALEISPSKVRVIAPYVGGAFGGKLSLKAESIAVVLAKETGKPVKVAFSREEVFYGATVRHPMTIYVKDGVTKEGQLLAREIAIYLNGGAYSEHGLLVARNCAYGAVATYKVPNFHLHSYGVYTNLPVAGAFRGFGSAQVIWALESQMDILAAKLGLDPAEMRLRNLLHEGDESVMGEAMHSIGTPECVQAVCEGIKWREPARTPEGPWCYGKGMAVGNKYSTAPSASCAFCKVHDDGTVEIRVSADEMGQGSKTVLAQMAAEEFQIDMADIRVITGDTTFTPYDYGSVSSRTTFNTGNAVLMACRDVKSQIFSRAAAILNTQAEDLEISGKRVFVKNNPSTGLELSSLFAPTYQAYGRYLREGGELIGRATWFKDRPPEDLETGRCPRPVAFWIHGAQAVEVGVNIETGEVKVLQVASAFDVGKAVNPKLCEGQIEGGVGMGIGSALYEKMVLDQGVVMNPTFMDYKIPTSMEVPGPGQVKNFLIEVAHREGPFGAKGLGEGVMVATAPAIASAVYAAVGVRLTDLPVSREAVLDALAAKSGRGKP